MEPPFIITIDGPAASGKSSLANNLAKELNYLHINSGLMYRALACIIMYENIDYKDEKSLAHLLNNIRINYNDNNITINGINFQDRLYSPGILETLAEVSKQCIVRNKLNSLQKLIASDKSVVVDGRDAGTVVFPDAKLKVFLYADIKVRAERRYAELTKQGIEISKEEIAKNLQTRDTNDLNRTFGPLKKAQDAIQIDNTNLSIQDQIEIIKNIKLQIR
ncbi:MAG: (d)CMP kinase [Solitalea-like symbiont of Tyrophagus putrescentiae]